MCYAVRDNAVKPLRLVGKHRVVNTLHRAVALKAVGIERKPCVCGEKGPIFHLVGDIRFRIPAELNLRHPDTWRGVLRLDHKVEWFSAVFGGIEARRRSRPKTSWRDARR